MKRLYTDFGSLEEPEVRREKQTSLVPLATLCFLVSIAPCVYTLLLLALVSLTLKTYNTVVIWFREFVFGYSSMVSAAFAASAIISLGLGVFIQIKRKRQKAPSFVRVWVAFAVSIIVLLSVVGSAVRARRLFNEFRQKTPIAFPPGTRLRFLWERYRSVGSETGLYIKVSIDRKDVSAFIEQSQFGQTTARSAGHKSSSDECFSRKLGWRDLPMGKMIGWAPGSCRHYCIASNENGDEMLIDLAHPKKAVVYVDATYW
ncbi:MAG: hypothetical protein ACYS76_01220 [Planctomycetota bacterium]|jgi:hypothetical protein